MDQCDRSGRKLPSSRWPWSYAVLAAAIAAILLFSNGRQPMFPPAQAPAPPGQSASKGATGQAAAAEVRNADEPRPSDWSIPASYRGKIVHRRVRYFPEKLLALTFDDGPDTEITPKILKTLGEHNAHATFFVLGQWAQRHPDLLKEMGEAGHAIGSHSFSHPARPSAEKAAWELEKTDAIIQEATGRKPALFRPPYGITNNSLTSLALQQHYAVILWTVSSADTTRIGVDGIIQNVVHTPDPGDIVLMHDGHGHYKTAQALPQILKELGAAGFKFVTVPELLRAWEEWQNRPGQTDARKSSSH